MSALASFHTWSSADPSSTLAGSADSDHLIIPSVSVHDLLDYTWHYQCVVSPTFSTAAAVAAALIATTTEPSSCSCRSHDDHSGHDGLLPLSRLNSSSSDALGQVHLTGMVEQSSGEEHYKKHNKFLPFPNGTAALNHQLPRVSGEPWWAAPHQCSSPAENSPRALCRNRERVALATANAAMYNDHNDRDGYVSLSTFINISSASWDSPSYTQQT